MFFSEWDSKFKLAYGEFPNTYLAFDTETTGFNRDSDLIVEIGHCLVEDGLVTSTCSIILNWSEHPIVRPDWLRSRLTWIANKMAAKGSNWHISYERMCQEGIKPEEAFQFYIDIFKSAEDKGIPIVGHNVFPFDEEMLRVNIVGFSYADDFELPSYSFDTLALENAVQRWPDPKVYPQNGESLREWQERCIGFRCKASLSKELLAKYKLHEKTAVDMGEVHSAVQDSILVHHLMQEYVQMSKLPPPTAKPANAATGKQIKHGAVYGDPERIKGQRKS